MAKTFSLNCGWRYSPRSVPLEGPEGLDDASWPLVNLPHANKIVPWHSFDDRDYQFVSTYRRAFTLSLGPGQRAFVDFDGVMTVATVYCNGFLLGSHHGGYLPFSFEVTEYLRKGAPNSITVEVDSSERPDIPPFGGRLDYLAFGGIYRGVKLRVVPWLFIEDIFAMPMRVLEQDRSVAVTCTLRSLPVDDEQDVLRVTATLSDGERDLVSTSRTLKAFGQGSQELHLSLENLGAVEFWDLNNPALYNVTVRLHDATSVLDERRVRIGFRDARFTPQGFTLNGRTVKLRGLNRHQTFPFVGGAMPPRVQRKDADILKYELKCNVVRTSHYPQSPDFLDRCDEIGLLVMEEIPGWQHVGDATWKDLAVRDTAEMIQRDRNRPSVILWGVRINESADDHTLYLETNEIARGLDPSRPTGGVRNNYGSERLEDVFTFNDFELERLRAPNHPLYLVTEYIGDTFATRSGDSAIRNQELVLRHARVLQQVYTDERYAGAIGWCAFDYNTHAGFGSGDRVCYHGVSDIFRIPKVVAELYRSQCDPSDEIVLEPAFNWTSTDFNFNISKFAKQLEPGPLGGIERGEAVICSNCDGLRVYVGDRLVAELEPDFANYGSLPHPPFVTRALAHQWGASWDDLRLEGYVAGRLAAIRRISGRGVDADLDLRADDIELVADGADATRVVVRAVDEFGNRRPYSTGVVSIGIEGPGEVVGENPFALVGGVGAFWVRAGLAPGTVTLHADHSTLGRRTVRIEVTEAPADCRL